MIAAFDTHYPEPGAQCACVLFQDWPDEKPFAEHKLHIAQAAAYEPGAFYKRELPAMLPLIQQLDVPIDVIVVDGYAWLGEGRPGLGVHLYQALNETIPVIGVAKSSFYGAAAVARPLLRGQSQNPLWISAVGLDLELAVQHIAAMHGPFRLPDLLKRVDQLCREAIL